MAITKEHALRIAKKLKATIDKRGGAHDIALIYHEGVLIAHFGIRRGSRKDAGHGHIPHSLHVAQSTCLGLAQCPVKREEWIQAMREQGLLEE